jgi:uncharacterized protein YjbI with pentapeptide repeats
MAEFVNHRFGGVKETQKNGLAMEFRPTRADRYITPPYQSCTTYGPGSTIANWKGAQLSNADLRWQNFTGVDFDHAALDGAVFWGATLKNANLRDADLRDADFTGTDITGADLSNANVDGTCFFGARYSQETRFPKDFGNPRERGCVGMNEVLNYSIN